MPQVRLRISGLVFFLVTWFVTDIADSKRMRGTVSLGAYFIAYFHPARKSRKSAEPDRRLLQLSIRKVACSSFFDKLTKLWFLADTGAKANAISPGRDKCYLQLSAFALQAQQSARSGIVRSPLISAFIVVSQGCLLSLTSVIAS